jgi:hypothetical protein
MYKILEYLKQLFYFLTKLSAEIWFNLFGWRRLSRNDQPLLVLCRKDRVPAIAKVVKQSNF